MKKRSVLFFAVFCIVSTLSAQKNMVQAGIVAQGFSYIDESYTGLSLGLENELSRHFSLVANLEFFRNNDQISFDGTKIGVRTFAWNLQPEVRFYFKEVFQGFFMGGNLSYNAFDYKYYLNDQTVSLPDDPGPDSVVGLGLTLGFTSHMTERLGFSIFATGDHTFNPGGYDSGAKFRFGARVGYKF